MTFKTTEDVAVMMRKLLECGKVTGLLTWLSLIEQRKDAHFDRII